VRDSSIMASKRIYFNQYFHRFQKWWNMSVEEIMEKDEKPPVPQEPATGAPAVKK
jgi:hypothetical protein